MIELFTWYEKLRMQARVVRRDIVCWLSTGVFGIGWLIMYLHTPLFLPVQNILYSACGLLFHTVVGAKSLIQQALVTTLALLSEGVE